MFLLGPTPPTQHRRSRPPFPLLNAACRSCSSVNLPFAGKFFVLLFYSTFLKLCNCHLGGRALKREEAIIQAGSFLEKCALSVWSSGKQRHFSWLTRLSVSTVFLAVRKLKLIVGIV